MAIIPLNEQFRTTVSAVDLTNKGSSLQQYMNNIFTMQDIDDTVNSAFEFLDEGNGDGIVIKNRPAANFGNVGLDAVDLSISDEVSTTYGATGKWSVAAGRNVTASAINAVAIGQNSIASADNSAALFGVATASNAIAIGTFEIGGALGFRSLAISESAYAFGQDAIAIGYRTVADATSSTAIGERALARAANATSIGADSQSDFANATAIGGATTTAINQIALGSVHTVLITALASSTSYADDTAAAAGGVLVGELYRDGSIVKIRVA